MSQATLSRPGQLNATSDGSFDQDNANFLKVFTGEVLTTYNTLCVMKGLHRERTITSGKSASFPVTGTATARYHVPGTPVLGSNKIHHAEKVINIDDLLLADVMIYNLDEAKNHYDIRAEYSHQVGEALAQAYDKNTLQVAILAARSGGTLSGKPGGSKLANAAYATDGKILASGIFKCAQTFDEKNVPGSDRSVVVLPLQYYLLAQTTELLNKDWGGSGVYADGTILKVADIQIVKSNNVPNGIVPVTAGQNNTYNGDFSKTVAACLQKDAIGTVKLRDLVTQSSGPDFEIMYQATLLVAKYAMGHGVLRPECAIELATA